MTASSYSSMVQVFSDIRAERERQDDKHGGILARAVVDDDHMLPLAILVEEVGEVAQEVLMPVERLDHLRAELIQVAAVAVAWVQAIEHGGPGNG